MTENSYKYDERGKLKKGFTANPEGRKSREREAAYLLIMKEVMTSNEWRNLCIDAYLAARGIRIRYVEGKADGYENDPLATPQSKLANKRFFADYLLPKTFIVEKTENGELMAMLNDMAYSIQSENDDKLDDIVKQATKYLEQLHVQPA